jgi:hypothetical protein
VSLASVITLASPGALDRRRLWRLFTQGACEGFAVWRSESGFPDWVAVRLGRRRRHPLSVAFARGTAGAHPEERDDVDNKHCSRAQQRFLQGLAQ